MKKKKYRSEEVAENQIAAGKAKACAARSTLEDGSAEYWNRSAERYELEAQIQNTTRHPVKIGVGGEAIIVGGRDDTESLFDTESLLNGDWYLQDTLKNPDRIAVEASSQRLDLIKKLDIVPLALDLSETVQVQNSMEKALVHQMAACHKKSMELMVKADDYSDPAVMVKVMNLSCRLMDTYRAGYDSIVRSRSGGRQIITVKHQQVNVASGGQAVIADNMTTGGGGRSDGDG